MGDHYIIVILFASISLVEHKCSKHVFLDLSRDIYEDSLCIQNISYLV